MRPLIRRIARQVVRQNFITRADLNNLEKLLDAVFHRMGIDIEFTKHFLDRVNDQRNRTPITFEELQRLFLATFSTHAKKLKQYGDQYEAVIVDVSSKINVPFILKWNPRKGLLELRNKTVMRKPNFRTRDDKLRVYT